MINVMFVCHGISLSFQAFNEFYFNVIQAAKKSN